MSDFEDFVFRELPDEQRHAIQDKVIFGDSYLRNLPFSSFCLLQKVGCKLIYGNTDNLMLDAAAYCFLCAKDEAIFNKARRLAVLSVEDFWVAVMDYLDANKGIVEEALPTIADQLKAYYASITKIEDSEEQKKT